MSAIFISHSSKDNAWAERIRDWLKGGEHKRKPELRYNSLFLDFDPEQGIPVGTSWRATLYQKLQLSRAVIVLCSEPYCASQWCVSELAIAIDRGKLVLPVRINDGPLPRLLAETQGTGLEVIDLEQGSEDGWRRLERGLEALTWRELQEWPPAGEPDEPPFPGLSSFERKHAPVFFGQDTVLGQLQDKLRNLPAVESRLLMILGASGCGKSSLLRAGLVPWLADGDRRRWIVLDPFRPEDDPFGWLAHAVKNAYDAHGQPAPSEPARTALALQGQLRDLRRHAGIQDARVVLAIDQFEELLGHQGSGEGQGMGQEADDFLKLLAELLTDPNGRVVILTTLRSDFLGSFQLHPSDLGRLAGEPVLLGPMEKAGFRQVIEGPAQRVGLPMETGLSDQLVEDTATGDALPLLAFTLSELWRERPAAGGLTLEQYREFGGLAGAVQKKADEVLSTSAPTEVERAALREAFLDHLVRLSDEGIAAKRPARWGDLPEASQRILRRFVDARLLVSGKGETRDTVEIAHEALLRTWPTLVDWIGQGRLELEQRRRVERLCEELDPGRQSEAKARHEAIEQLARMAALGGGASEGRAVAKVAGPELERLVANGALPEGDRADGALVLALIGAEAPLRELLADEAAPVGLRRRAAESLGLLASRCGDGEQRLRIAQELEGWLRSDGLDVRIEVVNDDEPALVEVDRQAAKQMVAENMQQARKNPWGPVRVSHDQLQEMVQQAEHKAKQQRLCAEGKAAGWAEHDRRLPLLQGASRGLQLAMATELPLLGSGLGQVVPMLTLTALEEGDSLRVITEVVEVPVWRLPLPGGEQLELVAVPAGETTIGSPKEEAGRVGYTQIRLRCEGVDVEAERRVRLAGYGMVRHPISQAQWRAVVEEAGQEKRGSLTPGPGSHRCNSFKTRYRQLRN